VTDRQETLRPFPPELEENCLRIQKAFDLHPLVARLLLQRGLITKDAIRLFLNGTLADLPNPFLLPDMDKAVERLLKAIRQNEKILFFGDYDVDGITGTAQLQAYFREIGMETQALLPHRMHDGYGLTESSVKKIAAACPDLLVTIDNGTNSREEIGALRQRGIDVIVIDHHEAPSEAHRPDVAALVNPKTSGSRFGERDIASAGLVFLLLMALRSRSREMGVSPLPNLKRYLDLASLGTVADVVPLTGTNRLLVKFGLDEIAQGARPGIRALKEISSVQPPVTTTSIAFRLAPRINAAGRLADPKLALDLLLATSLSEASTLAQRLEDLNRERQKIEEKVTAAAIEQIKNNQSSRHGITAVGEDWHLGVVGIVAAKLTERFGRPAVVLAICEDGKIAKGSARTVGKFSIYEALKQVESEMLRFGGHAAAAGLTVSVENLSHFAERFDSSVKSLWTEEHGAGIEIDSIVQLSDLNSALVGQLSLLEPHGAGNPEPIFLSDSVRLEGSRIVGMQGSGRNGGGHLKTLLCQNAVRVDAIGFNLGSYLERALKMPSHRVAYTPQINTWNGIESMQMKIKLISSN